jgi:hypothetical protein
LRRRIDDDGAVVREHNLLNDVEAEPEAARRSILGARGRECPSCSAGDRRTTLELVDNVLPVDLLAVR